MSIRAVGLRPPRTLVTGSADEGVDDGFRARGEDTAAGALLYLGQCAKSRERSHRVSTAVRVLRTARKGHPRRRCRSSTHRRAIALHHDTVDHYAFAVEVMS